MPKKVILKVITVEKTISKLNNKAELLTSAFFWSTINQKLRTIIFYLMNPVIRPANEDIHFYKIFSGFRAPVGWQP